MNDNKETTCIKELQDAKKRIGEKPDDVMKWLLDFAQTDFSKSSDEDILKARFELWVFTALDFWPSPKKSFIFHFKHIRHFQTGAMLMLNGILQHKIQHWRFTVDLKLTPSDSKARSSWKIYVDTTKDFISAFNYHSIYLLQSYAHRLLKCEECSKIFLSERSNQTHCSSKCRARGNMRNFREKHGLNKGRPRGRPRKAEVTKSKRRIKKSGKKTRKG